jgi:hypothetical protein
MAESTATLNAAAEAFYRSLPEEDYPRALIEGYPRIANHIVAMKDDKTALGEHFESLLSDFRGGRQGFPFPVLSEIQNLYDIMVGIPYGFVDTHRLLAILSEKK